MRALAAISSAEKNQTSRDNHPRWLPAAIKSPTPESDQLWLQRKASCACGGGCPSCQEESHPETIQPKLKATTPGDEYEQEADRVAEQVMRMPESHSKTAAVPAARASAPTLQRKRASFDGAQRLASDEVSRRNLLPGPGQPLAESERAFFEPRFGHDLSSVRVHADSRAAESARSVKARAYTLGRNIVFGAGEYAPGTTAGRLLLAHELTHVAQQGVAGAMLQRQHVPDTGFRFTPPATVKRTIVEIQGIVGVTPDGDYGENTKIAVEKYQTKLKAVGFYAATIDGKWEDKTEAAHVAFATAPNLERRVYNCAGFAFKDYKFHDLAVTKAKYAAMTKLSDCSKTCDPFFHKFWFWQFDLKTVFSGGSSPSSPDFHTVGGQTDGKGKGPDQVMSKNGQRPVEGPKPPLDWELKSGPAPDRITGVPVPGFKWVITGTTLECFCNSKLP